MYPQKIKGVNTAGMLLTSSVRIGGQTSGMRGSDQIGLVGSNLSEYASCLNQLRNVLYLSPWWRLYAGRDKPLVRQLAMCARRSAFFVLLIFDLKVQQNFKLSQDGVHWGDTTVQRIKYSLLWLGQAST